MNIEEAVIKWADMSENSVLVAKPPLTWGADALFVELDEDYCVPQKIKEEGYEYLLGREEIERWVNYLKKKKVGTRTAAEFIIHYSITDCTPEWIDDIPDI
ncbi:hypothetical protein [Cellvibrio mixtus]|uniref:hypothetical protein n=1 Tax=Cellvibrio mixtus TaxID=39650 RepID=UPI000587052D|nr:hypothetical protein [Cellvibrio mixtus]